MRPEDIRKLYHQEQAATDEEATRTAQEARTDPEIARAFLATLYSMSTEDVTFAMLLKLFLEGMLMKQIEERAATDDAFALECAKLITDLMESMPSHAPPPKYPRGKPKTTRSA